MRMMRTYLSHQPIPGAVNSLPLIYLKEITQVLVNSATNWISEELAESIVGLTFSDLATASTLTAKLGASIDYGLYNRHMF